MVPKAYTNQICIHKFSFKEFNYMFKSLKKTHITIGKLINFLYNTSSKCHVTRITKYYDYSKFRNKLHRVDTRINFNTYCASLI